MLHASYSYDSQYDFRITAITREGIGTQNYTYDDANLSSTVTDPDGNSIKTKHDVLGRCVQVTSSIIGGGDTPGTETNVYAYENGLLTQATESGRTMHYQYNSRGLVTNVNHSDLKSEVLSYDDNDNPVTVKDRSGQVYTYEYNPFDEVVNVKQGNNILTEYTYDNLGRVTVITGQDISYHNYFNDTGYLTHTEQTIKGRLYDLAYGYGAHDRLTSLILNNSQGQTLTQFGYDYTYPNTAVSAWVNGQLMSFATATTGSKGLLINKQLGNGLKLNYTYDNSGPRDGLWH